MAEVGEDRPRPAFTSGTRHVSDDAARVLEEMRGSASASIRLGTSPIWRRRSGRERLAAPTQLAPPPGGRSARSWPEPGVFPATGIREVAVSCGGVSLSGGHERHRYPFGPIHIPQLIDQHAEAVLCLPPPGPLRGACVLGRRRPADARHHPCRHDGTTGPPRPRAHRRLEDDETTLLGIRWLRIRDLSPWTSGHILLLDRTWPTG